jgi:hypothetical protein
MRALAAARQLTPTAAGRRQRVGLRRLRHRLAKRFPTYRRQRGVDRDRLAFHSFRKCFVRALELAGVDRDRAALVVGHERGFTFRVYNPEGLDLAMLREVVERFRYEGLDLTHC